MTPAEIQAYNEGVRAVLDIARRAAAAIASTSRRRVHEDFAIAALAELADVGRGLLMTDGNRNDLETRHVSPA